MKRVGYVLFSVLAIALMLGIASGTAMAQAAGDNSTYFVTYFSNNVSAAPDATVRVINDGDQGAPQPAGDLFAEFFVFDDSEELTQCCGCVVTPDGLLSESVKNQLTDHSLRGITPPRGVIKLISSSNCLGANCPGGPSFAPTTPIPGLRAWATHIQSNANKYPYGPAPYTQTETKFADANLGAAEKGLIEELCYFDYLLSGSPCTCTPEDYDF
ncbi:MAG: hypothetical protein WBS24_17625 [Terriglobales bacterium]